MTIPEMTDEEEQRERELTRWRNAAHAYASRVQLLEELVKQQHATIQALNGKKKPDEPA